LIELVNGSGGQRAEPPSDRAVSVDRQARADQQRHARQADDQPLAQQLAAIADGRVDGAGGQQRHGAAA
jgi:hypothetical protein